MRRKKTKRWMLGERDTFRVLMENAERFASKLARSNRRGCRPWLLKFRDKDGYGLFTLTVPRADFGDRQIQVTIRAHRCAWMIANGRPVPSGRLVLHKCDNPPCCDPTHLELGTQLKNRRDCSRRGRTATKSTHGDWLGDSRPRGIRHGNAKITEKLAARILYLAYRKGMRAPQVSAKTKVSLHICHQVIGRKTWRHVEVPK